MSEPVFREVLADAQLRSLVFDPNHPNALALSLEAAEDIIAALPDEWNADVLRAENERLRSALERTLDNFRLLLAQKPVRDATETIAEAQQALAAPCRLERCFDRCPYHGPQARGPVATTMSVYGHPSMHVWVYDGTTEDGRLIYHCNSHDEPYIRLVSVEKVVDGDA